MEIDNVHGERWVPRATGILPPIFEAELAGTRAKAGLDAIDSAMKRRAANAPAGEADVIASFIGANHAEAQAVAGESHKTAHGHTVIGATILAGQVDLR